MLLTLACVKFELATLVLFFSIFKLFKMVILHALFFAAHVTRPFEAYGMKHLCGKSTGEFGSFQQTNPIKHFLSFFAVILTVNCK